jgi:hypothetical protein
MSMDRVQRRAEILDLIAEAGLELALDLKDAALAAEDVAGKAAAAAEFHRVTRGLRQSLALQERFERSTEKAAREAETEKSQRSEAAVRVRKAQVRAAVERRIYQETEPSDARLRLEDLTDRLDDEALFEGFTDEAVDTHIARLADSLGLTGEARLPYTPRALRSAMDGRSSGVDWSQFYRGDEEEDEEGFEDDEACGDYEADFGDDGPEPPAVASAPPLPDPPPPDPDPPAPPPDPPPEPYIPPWERLRPGQSFPGGGSGW